MHVRVRHRGRHSLPAGFSRLEPAPLARPPLLVTTRWFSTAYQQEQDWRPGLIGAIPFAPLSGRFNDKALLILLSYYAYFLSYDHIVSVPRRSIRWFPL